MIPEVNSKPAKLRPRWLRLLFPTWGERKRLFIMQSWWFVALTYLAALFGILCPQHWRESDGLYVAFATGAFLIRTFLFHLGLILALILVVAACCKRWRLVAFTLPLWLVCHGPVLLSFIPNPVAPPADAALKVMSVNLLGCNTDTEGILAEIRAFQPDILALQEYRPHWHAAIRAALRDAYPYSCFEIRDDDFGQALYTRIPFASPPETELPIGDAETPQTRAVFCWQDREIAVYNIHLMPPKSIAYARRQRLEFADLLARLAAEELPVILCGDFNFTNDSPFADSLDRQGLTDVHRLCGRGRGATWPILLFYRYLPGLRLDHIFVTAEFRGVNCGVGVGRGSDHRPIFTHVTLRGE